MLFLNKKRAKVRQNFVLCKCLPKNVDFLFLFAVSSLLFIIICATLLICVTLRRFLNYGMLQYFITTFPLFVCGFWLVYFVSCKLEVFVDLPEKPHDPVLRAVTLFFFSATLLYGCHFLYFAGYGNTFGKTVYAVANLCVYPLFYVFLSLLTNSDSRGSNKVNRIICSILFVPALIVLTAHILCFLTGNEGVRRWFTYFARVCFALQVVCVWISGSRLLRRYHRDLDDFYSDNRSHRLRPLHILLQLFGAIALISGALNIIGREWFVGKTAVIVPSVLMSVLLYALGYVISRLHYPVPVQTWEQECSDLHPTISSHSDSAGSEKENDESDDTESPSSERVSLKNRLEQLMQDDKPYLRANLTVQDLAAMLLTNRTYLSQMFRDDLNTSFSSYINTLRIEHSKRILADLQFETNKEAIIAAQVESGFASDSTFYHLFKQHTGISPLVYRQQQLSLVNK